jgi:hypothetical protein
LRAGSDADPKFGCVGRRQKAAPHIAYD